MDGSGKEMDGREETFTGGTKLKQLAEAGEFKCGRFKFTFFFLTLFSVFRLKKRKKKRGRRKLNEGIFVISPLICERLTWVGLLIQDLDSVFQEPSYLTL